MRKFAVWIILCAFLTMTTLGGCAYEQAYGAYAKSMSDMAASSGALIKLGPDGRVIEVGNPMVGVAMMQMQAPKDGWTQFFDFLKFATPFAAIWGVAGALSSNIPQGSTTNVTGNSNLTGNTAGPAGGASSWASPVTTTTTTIFEGIPAE
jgi:hypothetical protein